MNREMVRVVLVNVNQVRGRDLILQTGAYGEHECLRVEIDGKQTPVNHRFFRVHLAPGAGAEMTIWMRRYANPPTLAFP